MKSATLGVAALAAIGVAVGAAALLGSTGQVKGAGDVARRQDVEALARMLASENPRGSLALWVEQCWTQINSRRRGQSLYDRITGSLGFGPQGGRRPVSTAQPAEETHRIVARLVLLGAELSRWARRARKFFEPDTQDRMFALGEIAREKLRNGEPLTAEERRALPHTKNAAAVRSEWAGEGARPLGTIDGVEFWS